jgi:hypothetical protein
MSVAATTESILGNKKIDVDNKIWWGNLRMGHLRERDHWGDPGIDGRIMLRWILRKWDMDWTELAHDRDRWRSLVNAVMNLQVP